MLPDPFTTEDGDVILRVGPDDTFRVHKVVLSLVSPVFRDLFRTAQPDQPDGGQGILPTIPITDPPESVDLLLRFIYPGVAPPNTTDPIKLSALLTIADKYGVPTVPPAVKERLADEGILEKDPFGVYIVARRWGFPCLAKKAARGLTLPKVMASPSSKDPQNFAGDDFFRLVWFMKERDEVGKREIRSHFLWDPDPFVDGIPYADIPCGQKTHVGGDAVVFYQQLAEKIVDGFEIDPRLDKERMVEVFVNGPDPPPNGFCRGINLVTSLDGFLEFCPIRPSRIMSSLCSLVSSLDLTYQRLLTKAMDGEFPT